MDEAWRDDDGTVVREADLERVLRGQSMVTLSSSLGRVLMFVSNGARAMVVVMDHEGDAGQHLADPVGVGVSGGYVLDNGQVDEYPDRDTVELAAALDAVRGIVGGSRASLMWVSDR